MLFVRNRLSFRRLLLVLGRCGHLGRGGRERMEGGEREGGR